LNNVDHRARRHWIAQMVAIAYLAAIDKNRHMLPQPALVIEHIAARLLVQVEVVCEHVAYRGSFDLGRGTRNVPLDVLRESDGRHDPVR
jgi:hypothetical protein